MQLEQPQKISVRKWLYKQSPKLTSILRKGKAICTIASNEPVVLNVSRAQASVGWCQARIVSLIAPRSPPERW